MFARAWPILCFVLGLFASEAVYQVMRARGASSTASITLGIEALFIALVIVVLPLPPDSEMATTAGLRFFVPVGLLAREAANWMVSVVYRRRGSNAGTSARRALLMAAVWSSYVGGALLGVRGRAAIGLRSLVFPLIVLLALVALDRVRPLGGHDMPDEPHPIF
jgi:uncharacterized membrane protein YoaK (UPF0700 family)